LGALALVDLAVLAQPFPVVEELDETTEDGEKLGLLAEDQSKGSENERAYNSTGQDLSR